MKRVFFLFLTTVVGIVSFAQQSTEFTVENIKSKEDAISAAKKAVAYILSSPIDTGNRDRKLAETYLALWMTSTEDYSFSMYISMTKIIQEDKFAGYVLMAGIADCVFKDKAQTDERVTLLGMKKLVEYATDPENNLKPGYELRKVIKADRKGKLEEYLMQVDK